MKPSEVLRETKRQYEQSEVKFRLLERHCLGITPIARSKVYQYFNEANGDFDRAIALAEQEDEG